jgi:non-lysosomal glucosylceramidase
LGGIGAGKVEFCADGRFTNVTTNNNWDAPIVNGTAQVPAPPRVKEGFPGSIAENATRRQSIFSPEGLPGAWMAVHTPHQGACVLKTVGRPAFRTLPKKDIEFHGLFPRVSVDYRGFEPLGIHLEAFSSLDLVDGSPGYRDSSLPLALFHFRVRNMGRDSTPVTLAFSWQNLSGVGGYPWNPINEPDPAVPEYRKDEFGPGLFFGHDPDIRSDPRVVGEYSLRVWTSQDDTRVSHCVGWNPLGDGRDVWDSLAHNGSLSNQVLRSTAGALAVRIDMGGGETVSVVFALSWYYPHLLAAVSKWEHLVGASSAPPNPEWVIGGAERPDYGHAYCRWFEDSWSIAEYGLRHWKSIHRRVLSWQGALVDSSLPSHASTALCNHLFPLFTNTWYTREGAYSTNEAPTDMKGCMGTIDQRAVANAIAASAFPALDRAELELFAADQIRAEDDPRRFGFHWNTTTGQFDLKLDREGAILHDIGWDHLEGGRYGRLGWLSAHWPDLSSVFVLQVYQHAIWNGSQAWLEKIYPHVQAALRFQARLDQNGNGLADLWGSGCCTYDTELYPYFGSSSFVGTLYLATLKAAAKMADLLGDNAYANRMEERFGRAKKVLEDELWDETRGYYISWRDPDYGAWAETPYAHEFESPNCHIAQLAGAWYADLLCLGEIVNPDRRVTALKSIDCLNVAPLAGCPANEVTAEGAYAESWPAYALAYYAAQAISAGLPTEGWRAVERTLTTYQRDGSYWDTPLEWAGEGNLEPQWGRWYMSNPASWYLLLALGGVRLDLLEGELHLYPSWPAKWGDCLDSLPVFLPGVQFGVTAQRGPESWSVRLALKRIEREPLLLRRLVSRLPAYLDPSTVSLELSGLDECQVKTVPDGRILVSGSIRLASVGDELAIAARVNV